MAGWRREFPTMTEEDWAKLLQQTAEKMEAWEERKRLYREQKRAQRKESHNGDTK